jgi:magnesium chelatase family protein
MASMSLSIAESGGQASLITIECHITAGLPSVIIVGFANRAVDEAKERLRAAFHAAKLEFPKKRITINLAPADLPKESSGFDLAMAVSVMRASKLITEPDKQDTLFIGELGLNGSIRAVRGIIGKLLAAKSRGIETFYIPMENLGQALLVPGVTVIGVPGLQDLYNDLTGTVGLPRQSSGHGKLPKQPTILDDFIDLSDISGQERAKRVLEIAAAGGHNVLFNGPPVRVKVCWLRLCRAFYRI